jgi:hypothetical protein
MTEKWKCPEFDLQKDKPTSAVDCFFHQHEDLTTQGPQRLAPNVKFREDLAAMVNEILAADRAQRGDPRLAEWKRVKEALAEVCTCTHSACLVDIIITALKET